MSIFLSMTFADTEGVDRFASMFLVGMKAGDPHGLMRRHPSPFVLSSYLLAFESDVEVFPLSHLMVQTF